MTDFQSDLPEPATEQSHAPDETRAAPALATPRAHYAPRQRDPKLLTLVIALHAAAALALVLAPHAIHRTKAMATLKTFDIAPPPPPATLPEPAPDLPTPPLVTPPPVVSLPMPAPTLVAPELPPVIKPAPPAPAAAPVPAPVPATPPDFSASQLKNPSPAYPFLSRRAREEGVVMLKVLVTEDGRAGDIRIEETSGFERLDDAALKTVKRWRFLPARQAGKAITAWVLVPITFSLR